MNKNQEKYPEIFGAMEKEREKENVIKEKTKPMQLQMKEITAEIDALKAKKIALGEKIREYHPELKEIRMKISSFARAMGGKSLSRPN